MSDWKVVVPEATTNLISHPSVEDISAAGLAAFVAVNVATRALSTVQSRWALRSLAITPHAANANSGVYYQVTGLVTTTFTLSVWVYGSVGIAYQLRIEDSTPAVLATTAFVGTGAWQLVEVTGTTLADDTIRCHLTADLGGTPVFYADGWQLEQKAYRTTYCDGEQDGCEWEAVVHASPSSRSAQSRAGGLIQDLETVYGLNISGTTGFGISLQTVTLDEYAILPGGELGNIKIHPRSFTLSGTLVGTSYIDLHNKRQALITLFDPDAYPGEQPILLRYTGTAIEREIAVHYQSGLEAIIRAEDPCWWEVLALRFMAAAPFWYEVGETSQLLDSNDAATFRYVAGRLRDTGQWDDLGLTANPVGGTGHVNTLEWGPDGNLYIGGNFTGLDGTAGAASIDYIACWDPETGTWSQVGAAGDLNGIVYILAFDSTGLLHVGGLFTNAGAVAAADYIATWDGTNWAALGTPGEAGGRGVYDLAWDSVGDLYVVGVFTAWAGGASDYISRWDGTAWNAVGDPDVGAATINWVYAIVIDSQDTIFVGGNFTDWANDADADYVAQWDGTTWTALGTLPLNNLVYALALRPDDEALFCGGTFGQFGAETLMRIGLWNGANWEPLGSGLIGTGVHNLKIAPDGVLLIGGNFTQAGDIVLNDSLVKWNGSVFSHLDVDFGGTTVHSLEIGSVDPVVEQNYDIFVSPLTDAEGYFAGTATAANGGTELMFPSIKVSRDAGDAARLIGIRNEVTGKELLCDYPLLDGEVLEIILEPTEKAILSSYFGLRLDAVQASSDLGAFALQIGDNQVTCFVDVTGVPTIVAWTVGRTKYASQD